MDKAAPDFLQDLHGFRGFAILNVVVAHVFSAYFSTLRKIAPLDHASEVLNSIGRIVWHDSTIYFALISGLLFSRILAMRRWTSFFESKFRNVILPYAIMTLLFSLFWYEAGQSGNGLAIKFEGLIPFFDRYVSNLLQGTAVYVYWYIPVLACLFLATPLLYTLARKNPVALILVTLLPLVVSRAGNTVCVQTVVYFIGAYAAGIYAGINYERTLLFARNHFRILVGVSVAATAVLGLLFDNRWEFFGTVSLRETTFYVQKLSFSALMLVFLGSRNDKLAMFLGRLAKYAFAIYFIHLFFVMLMIDIALAISPPPIAATSILLMGTVLLVAVLALSIIVARTFRMVFGRRARMIVGA